MSIKIYDKESDDEKTAEQWAAHMLSCHLSNLDIDDVFSGDFPGNDDEQKMVYDELQKLIRDTAKNLFPAS